MKFWDKVKGETDDLTDTPYGILVNLTNKVSQLEDQIQFFQEHVNDYYIKLKAPQNFDHSCLFVHYDPTHENFSEDYYLDNVNVERSNLLILNRDEAYRFIQEHPSCEKVKVYE